jgi:hypothetical protein
VACKKGETHLYTITVPLHVSGLLVAYHQEVTMYICDTCYVLYVLVDCQLVFLECSIPKRPAGSQRTNCCMYTLLPPEDGQLAKPKHVEV